MTESKRGCQYATSSLSISVDSLLGFFFPDYATGNVQAISLVVLPGFNLKEHLRANDHESQKMD